MRRKVEEFYLDWKRDRLMGWESPKSALVIAAMIEGIRLGHDFPAVDVIRRNGTDIYELFDLCSQGENWLQYGGHHRALAHRIEMTPLKCNVVRERRARVCEGEFLFPIEEVSQAVNTSVSPQLASALGYLPLDAVERFCALNGVDFGELKEDTYFTRVCDGRTL